MGRYIGNETLFDNGQNNNNEVNILPIVLTLFIIVLFTALWIKD